MSLVRWRIWVVAACVLLPNLVLSQSASSDSTAELELGRRIYTEGVLSSGAELVGSRAGRAAVVGTAAACVNCHRPSGMGQVEAEFNVPPINGSFLFATRAEKRVSTMDPHVSKRFNQAHEPYTDMSLALAIRNGINSQGREMGVAMPRFNLSESDLRALTVYLKLLSSAWSPGVSETAIHFATVITPDVEPARRKVMIDMLQTILRQKNSSTVTPAQRRTRHHMVTAAEMILGTERNWTLDIWELKGSPETWQAQLVSLYMDHPVFALVSGLSNGSWQPVHDFCSREHVPCWFPSVNIPGQTLSPYAFYFSGGVGLEAAALARQLKGQKNPPKQVVQIFRDAEAGRAASQRLTQALVGSGITVSNAILGSDQPARDALRQVFDTIKPDDVLMFWFRPEDAEVLAELNPVRGKSYFSGSMARGEEVLLNPAWRENSFLVYPYDLPGHRAKNLDYFHAWLNINKLPLIDEPMQSEVFFALSFLTDTLAEMLDNIYRDYLVERGETMLSVREGVKSEQETRDRAFLGRSGDLLKKHGVPTIHESARIDPHSMNDGAWKGRGTTLYPHLSLAPNQRFASKGAYIVRFAHDTGKQLKAESDWIVP
jgi:hypothetical protein